MSSSSRHHTRRLPARTAAAVLLAVPVLLQPHAAATPAPRLQTQEEKDAALLVTEAAGDLEDSSQVVQAAAVALRTVAARLPAAQADVARTRGEFAGARAKSAAAGAALARAEQARDLAVQEVAQASLRVDRGREDVARLARRAYQRSALSDLRDVMDADDPQDVLVRAGLLRRVFRSQGETIGRLQDDRLELARDRSELSADERRLASARERAQAQLARADRVAVTAEAAVTRLQTLAARRTAALQVAEANRAQDLEDYQAAQAASRALGERIRQAARRAAAQAAALERKLAAEEAARRAVGRPSLPRPATPARRTGDMQWPGAGRMTSRFGYRTHPIYGDRRFHAGIDIGGGLGAQVSAADGGTVTYAGYASGFGTLVVISHGVVDGQDLSTAYGHMQGLSVAVGQQVSRGDKVGENGNEGNSTGPHLHFEVRTDGNPVDPLDYVDAP